MCKKCMCVLDSLIMITVLGLLIILVVWSREFFVQLIDNMKESRTQIVKTVSQQTNDVDKKVNNSITICEAYEALDRELTSWLTVLAIAGALFGLIAPLIGYLLQQHSLKEERKNLREEIKDKENNLSEKLSEVNKRIGEIKSDADEKILHINERSKKSEVHIIRSVEFPIVVQINEVRLAQGQNQSIDSIVVANIVIGFDYLLESLIHWDNDVAIVRAKIIEWISIMDAMWRKLKTEQREMVCALLRKYFKPSSEFGLRDDFVRILRADSTEFKWLEEFFEPFAPWKFS